MFTAKARINNNERANTKTHPLSKADAILVAVSLLDTHNNT